MNIQSALVILQEVQKWRRSEPPYDGDTPETHRDIPYSPIEYGDALNFAIEELKKCGSSDCRG